MKKIIFIIITVALPAFCFAQTNVSDGKSNKQESQDLPPDSSFRSFKFISLSDAEKVLEHPAHLKDSLLKFSEGLLRFQFTYKANFKDTLSGEIGTLFFGFEQWGQTAIAKRNYDLIKAENEKNFTVSNLDQVNGEGFLAKDKLGYPFIMIVKDKRIFKLKLRNVSGKSSLDELQALAKKIVSLH